MSCNNITHISTNMCNKICNDNIPASNTDQLTHCNTKCNRKIINELNPVDITNNFIFLNSADVAENALEIAGEQSQKLYEEKKNMMNSLITNMEKEIEIQNAGCGIRIGAKWKKIIDGDKNNEFIDNDYIKKFKRYSAFGLKWKHVGETEPDTTKYIKLVKDGDKLSAREYDYLNDALISGKDTQNNTILNKKALIDNNLFLNDDTADFKIYPNSYIKLTDNTYCQVYDYSIIDISDAIVRDSLKSIFNGGNPDIDLTESVQKVEIFENVFFDLTIDDFVINNRGDIYIPSIGCTDFDNDECIVIEDLLSQNENCMVNNKDNDYIKRKDTIPYLFHNDSPSWCKTNALKFNNKNELFDIINLITYDKIINEELNEMMGKYEVDRYEKIKTRINHILEGEYSQYFSTNDFLNLFNNDIQYWITIDDALFNQRSYRYNRPNTSTGKGEYQATGTYDFGNKPNIRWKTTTLPTIGSEFVNTNLTTLLDSKFTTETSIISLTDEELSAIQIDSNIDIEFYYNNTYVTSSVSGRYYIVNIENFYNGIAKILSNYIPEFPSSNHLIELTDIDVERIRTLCKSETISKKRIIENILDLQDYFNIIHDEDNSTKVILYTPLYEHYDNREAIYYDSHLNFDDWSSKSGIDFYEHLNNGQKKIQNDIIGSYGKIGYDEGLYNNVILSHDYITKTECEAIKLNVENTSNTIFLNENIENRHKLDKYRLNDIDFNDVNDELSQYDTNIGNLNRCLENSKTMINLDTYTKTKEYDNINQNIRDNAEINKKYNIYSSKVNKYDGIQTDCKLLSEYNNKDTCGISGETTHMCLTDDFISDTQYDTELQSKKDSLKSYIFNRQKIYYVGKNTLIPNTWQITTDYPNIGLELVNTNLTDLLDTKSITATDNIITLSDDELLPFSDSKIDNNTYISSSTTPGSYYTVNLQQEICNQPNDYVLQNSESICGGDKQCAYENEYNNSISEISQYDDNLCTNKYNYLEVCYNQDPDFVMGKQVDYSVCSDDQQEAPRIIDCPQTEDPQCPSGSYITYKIENGRYTCEKVCGSCVPNTTLNVSDSKCHANIGYYYDYEYDELESTNPQVSEQCQQGYYIDVTGAKTIEECNQCISECDDDHYETVDCTFSTNRVCTQLPDNSTKNQNGIDFVCDENYFKRGDQCVACPDETTSEPGSTSILQCRANEGHYFDPESLADDETLPIPASATECDDGKYCASGATSETPCPDNTTSVARSTAISQCYADPGFFYNNAIHSEGQSCLPGHYCPGGPGSGSTIQNPCPANTYNSLSEQTNVNACNPCEYETTSLKGSEACTACPAIPILAADRDAIRTYKYYEYQLPGCSISTGTCINQQLSPEELNDEDCPTTKTITDAYGRTITKKQFYGYTGALKRHATSGKPILFPVPPTPQASQEELTRKLKFEDPDWGFEYTLGDEVNLECEKTCMTCLPNEKFIPNLSACDPCIDNKVAGPDGLNCIPCNDKVPNTIYDAGLGDCTLCNDYQLPNFNSNTCENPQPGYYVVCDATSCVETKAELNKIVLGQINKVDWEENIKSIIFDYEQLTLGTVANIIDIIFRNDTWIQDKTLQLTKKTIITDNKYYKDISQNIIIFENDTPTGTDFLIKFMESIYISNSTLSSDLPNKLILQTENDSYYLLTHRMQQDITNRYSTAAIWDNSYLIFDMYLNITNEQYLCPDNTYIDDGTEIEADGSARGTNRNICKYYDSGYYRDIYTSSSGDDSSSLSSASTEEPFTNYENFASRTQTTCLKDFTPANIATIDITESILGAQSGGDRAGCVYKCNTAGHYYNEGEPGMADNKCEPCPIGYKCDNLRFREACIGQEYQNETGQTVCKTIPTDGTAILQGLANIGFSVPEGKKYNNVDNTISDCSIDTYKNTESVINNLETEREIQCPPCPLKTTTKGGEGSTELAQCIPNFGYTLDTTDGIVTTLTGYDDSSGSIQCAREYYLGDFVGVCDTVNPNRNECTECLGENDKACISCPTGYTCAGGSVDCKANPAIPQINAGHIDYNPLTVPIYTIDACWPGMKLIGGECDPCNYTSGGSETGKYCFNGRPSDHISASTGDIKLKNNDNFTPAIYITAADNANYNINTIAQDSGDPNNIVFSFKNNYIPANIEDYLEMHIQNLKNNDDIPLYLYEHASGEKNANKILDAKNVTQPVGVSITGNTIDLLKEGYISNEDALNYNNIIRNIILSNNLKFTGDEKDALLDIIISYNADKLSRTISDDMNLSFIYEFEYYDGTQLKIQSYVYRILPYHSVCDEGTHTTTGLINSCEYCPRGTYKSTADASSCQKAEGRLSYVGVNTLSVSGRSSGLGGITVSEMPDSLGFEMLTTSDGGNYGYKLKSGYGYTALNGEATACGMTSFNEEQILIDNTIDNTANDYLCTSCPAVASLPLLSQTGLLRLGTNSPTSTTATACDIKVCDTNYTNIGGVDTNLCELEKCPAGHYFNGNSNSCEICPVGHYCNGDQSKIPTVDSHQKRECPVNTYNDTTGISLERDCITCPLNTSTDDATGSTSITDCISNAGWYFNSSTDATATECPPGKYCPINTTGPLDNLPTCPTNTTSPAGSSSFSHCRANAGWYYPHSSADVSTLAAECPEKTYCEGANESAVNCPLNTNTGGGTQKTQKSECVADPGYYYDIDDATYEDAQACPAGTYNPDYNKADVSYCIKCPENTYNTNSGSSRVTDCQGCPPNTSTTYDDDGNLAAGVEITGKSLLTDCKPGKMYERNPSNEIILKTGHTKNGDQYMCDQEYYFDNDSGECVLCRAGFWCAGGPATAAGAVEEACPDYSTSSTGSSEIADCEPILGYKRVDDTFVKNEGVKTDASGLVVFKPGTATVQCLPGYEGKTGFDEECQSCTDGSTFSLDGNACSPCAIATDTQLVIRNCDTMNNTIKIDKSILRIDSLDTVSIIQALNYELTVSHLYTNACIIPQTHTYPDYNYLLPSPSNLYFIKLSKTYTQLPVEVGANIHSKVTPVEINDNVIERGTSSYAKIIAFIPSITSQTKILDLCYFLDNGVEWEVFLLLPKCGCVPGTFGDNCYFCPTSDAAGRQQFQPYYNQDECISVPTTILDDSYSFIQDATSTYNIGVNLNAGWAMNSSGESSLCAADTYYALTTEITADQIVNDVYPTINCTNCPNGTGTQNNNPDTGATAISDCTVKFGYKETSPATTPATYEYDTGYEDVVPTGIIDCKAGYYFDDTSCVECPAGYYCEGGVASSISPDGATATPCPVGTYNSNIGSKDVSDCTLINRDTEGQGRGYYGTKMGATDYQDGFQMCPENTSINSTSNKLAEDCDVDDKYNKIYTTDQHTGQTTYIIELKQQYSGENTCLPGAFKNTSGNGVIECSEPPAGFYVDPASNGYLSGNSSVGADCATADAGSPHLLKNCDAFTNSIVNSVSNLEQSTHPSGGAFFECKNGYKQIHYDALDTNNADTIIADAEKKIINDSQEFYLYQYWEAFDLDEAIRVTDPYGDDSNYHLNTDTSIVHILKYALTNNNLKVISSHNNSIKWIIKTFKKEQDKITAGNPYTYQLLFYDDIDVYKTGEGKKTMRYIYGIVPSCQECPLGDISDGFDYCTPCTAGTKQNVDDLGNKICETCPDGTYQDVTGQMTCKQLPQGYAEGALVAGDVADGYTDFKIRSGYYYTTDSHTITKCPENKRTDNYQSTGQEKEDAIECISCPPNQKQSSSGYECNACPTGAFLNKSTGVCTSCDSVYLQTTLANGLGVTNWGLADTPRDSGVDKTYCIANSCDTPLYKTSTTGLCELNECPAGYYFNGTDQVCQACPAGHYCPDKATEISQEVNGNWLPAKTACGPGKYSTGTGQHECLGCPINTSHGLTGSTNETACVPDPGYYGPAGGTAIACGNGKYKSSAGEGTVNLCLSCPINTSHVLTGRTNVDDCVPNAGYIGPAGGPAIACGTGTYKPSPGQSSCTTCPDNTNTTTAGSTNVDQCVANAGYYSDDSSGITQCPQGTYKGSNGAGPCTACPTNYWTDDLGNTAESDCEPSPGYTGSPATECAVGTYKNSVGYGACTQCGSGLTTSGTGSNAKTDCIAASGYYATPDDGSWPNNAQACPGVPQPLYFPYTVPLIHGISTEGERASLSDCRYAECNDGYYRHENGMCTAVTAQDCQVADDIFVPYRKSGNGTTYSTYDAAEEGNYSLLTMYGHDNLCLPVSQICT